MFSLVACSEDIPPKGDHSAKQPAAPAPIATKTIPIIAFVVSIVEFEVI